MKKIKIKPLASINTSLQVPADKSISHRALLISAIARGRTRINNFLESRDTMATFNCLKKLTGSVIYMKKKKEVKVTGKGLYFPVKKKVNLNAGESGTTIRLISGIMSGQRFPSVINAAQSLRERPMKRITAPLSLMGADIRGIKKKNNQFPPLAIAPVPELCGIRYEMPQASAQVKSALLLASLYAGTKTKIKEPNPSRDHTERMLRSFGAKVSNRSGYLVCGKTDLKSPGNIFIPGDFSSAAFFIVLGLLLPGSELTIKKAGINPTRTGLLKVLKRMKAKIMISNRHDQIEPYADIKVKYSSLYATDIRADEIPLMIDEVPVLMTAAAFAGGTTRIYGLKELKVKETDRIQSMVYNLKKAGADIKPFYDKKKKDWQVFIKGKAKIKSSDFKSFNDHRTAMSMIIFALASGKDHTIDDVKCIDKSFPEFMGIITKLRK